MPEPLYLLDTDISSYVMKRSHASVLARLALTRVGEVCLSVINKGELLYGVAVSPRAKQDGVALEAFLRNVLVLDWPDEAASHYAAIRADLKKKGTPIGGNDLLIAAHARALDLTLVTNNVREYQRVVGLKIENWVDSGS